MATAADTRALQSIVLVVEIDSPDFQSAFSGVPTVEVAVDTERVEIPGSAVIFRS